jgi:Mg2+ and Co2+ transporter CorA
MKFFPLYITIIVFWACESNSGRFDIKGREFQRKSSHHYSDLFAKGLESPSEVEEFENKIPFTVRNHSNKSPKKYEVQIIENERSIFKFLTNIFSSTEQEDNSIVLEIIECEERLFTREDELVSKRLALNSLINERNQLLKQLDSLQTELANFRRNSNNRLRKIEAEHRKMQSLVDILSREIE